jgi:hypothetical protein
MHQWSLDREPFLLSNRNERMPNPNWKQFKSASVIKNAEYLEAYHWDRLNKLILHLPKGNLFFIKASMPNNEEDLKITTQKCKQYIQRIQSCAFVSLDELFQQVHAVHVVKINKEEWKLSECSCKHRQKNHIMS